MKDFRDRPLIVPWILLLRLIRFHTIVIGASLLALFLSNRVFIHTLFEQVGQKSAEELLQRYDFNLIVVQLPLFLLFYAFALLIFMNFSRTVKILLAQITHLEQRLPKSLRLKLIYNEEDMAAVEEALTLPEKKIEKQLQIIKSEDRKNKILLDSITEGIFAINTSEQSLFFNHNFIKKFLPSHNNPVPKKLRLDETDLDPQIIEAYQQSLKTTEVVTIKDFLVRHRNRDLYFDIKINPIFDSDSNDIVGAMGIFYNMTERKLADQMRVDFVANASHEMMTPLTSLLGYSQLITEESTDPAVVKDFCIKINNNALRLQHLYNDLLNLSLIESKHKINKRVIDLKPLIESVKSTLSPRKQNILTVSYNLNHQSVRVDTRLFDQVIGNLLHNAVKYGQSSDGTTYLTIGSHQQDNNVIITISDRGKGIPQEHTHRIFERFYRVDPKENSTKGTGLGLSIVKHAINKHKGTIHVESTVEEGTTFVIKIPV